MRELKPGSRNTTMHDTSLSVGIVMMMILELPWELVWHRAALVPVNQVLARTSYCALGGLHPSTNELIGEDLGVIIRLDCQPVMS